MIKINLSGLKTCFQNTQFRNILIRVFNFLTNMKILANQQMSANRTLWNICKNNQNNYRFLFLLFFVVFVFAVVHQTASSRCRRSRNSWVTVSSRDVCRISWRIWRRRRVWRRRVSRRVWSATPNDVGRRWRRRRELFFARAVVEQSCCAPFWTVRWNNWKRIK